jgi:hypothetical protein
MGDSSGRKRQHIAYARGQFAGLDQRRDLFEAPGRHIDEKEEGS